MSFALFAYDLRRSRLMLNSIWLVVMGFVLFEPGPLRGGFYNVNLPLALLVGALIAVQLMSDTGGTHSYVCSRGLTRQRIVALRLAFGTICLATLGLSIWIAIAIGLRERLHVFAMMPDAVFYPMSTRFETAIVAPFVLGGTGSFCVMSFVMAWRGLCNPSKNATGGGIARLALLEIPVGVVTLFMCLTAMIDSEMDGRMWVAIVQCASLGFSLLAIVGTLIAARSLEVA